LTGRASHTSIINPQGFENLEVFFLTCLYKSIGTKRILQMLIANHNPPASEVPDGVTMKCYFLPLKTLSDPTDADRFFDLNPQGFENLEGLNEVFFLFSPQQIIVYL